VCKGRGWAAGIGFQFALAADFTFATTDALFWEPFAQRAFTPDSGATWFLPRLIGAAKAAELALAGDTLDAGEALRLGLVSRVVPGDQLLIEARALADRLAEAAPIALALTKAALQRSATLTLDEALDGEAKVQGIAGASADHAEGLAAFREKRPPRFTGS